MNNTRESEDYSELSDISSIMPILGIPIVKNKYLLFMI